MKINAANLDRTGLRLKFIMSGRSIAGTADRLPNMRTTSPVSRLIPFGKIK